MKVVFASGRRAKSQNVLTWLWVQFFDGQERARVLNVKSP